MMTKRTTLATTLALPALLLLLIPLQVIAFTPSTLANTADLATLDKAVDTMERFFYKNYKKYKVNSRTQLLGTPFYTTNITLRNNAISQVVDFYNTDKYLAMHMFYTKSGVRATRYNQLDSKQGSKPYSRREIIRFVNSFLELKLSPLLEFQSQVIEPIPNLDGFYLIEVKEYYSGQFMQSYTLISDGDVVTFDLINIGSGIEYGDFYQYHHPDQAINALDYNDYMRIYGNGRSRNKMLFIADLDNTYTEMIVDNYLPLFKQIPSVDIYFLPFPQKSRYVRSQILTNIFSVSQIMGNDLLKNLTSHNISQYNSSEIADYFTKTSDNPEEFATLLASERIKLEYDNIVFQNLYLGLDVTPWIVYNGNVIKGYNEAMFLYILSNPRTRNR